MKMDISTKLIDSSARVIYEIAITDFLLSDRPRKIQFFTILFLILSNTDRSFAKKKLFWRSYRTAGTPSITIRVELICKRKFAATVLNKNVNTYVVYVAALEIISIHSTEKARILWLPSSREYRILPSDQQLDRRDIVSFVVYVSTNFQVYINKVLVKGFDGSIKMYYSVMVYCFFKSIALIWCI